jgi:hypothetical protein
MTLANDMDDDLSNLFGGAPRPAPAAGTPAADFVPSAGAAALPTGNFEEQCWKCRGTGRYGNLGQCFKCAGKGKLSFATSPEARANARQGRVARATRNAAEASAELAARV